MPWQGVVIYLLHSGNGPNARQPKLKKNAPNRGVGNKIEIFSMFLLSQSVVAKIFCKRLINCCPMLKRLRCRVFFPTRQHIQNVDKEITLIKISAISFLNSANQFSQVMHNNEISGKSLFVRRAL